MSALYNSLDFTSIAVALIAIIFPFRYAVIPILLAAMYQETSSALPAGLYFCCYLTYGFVLGMMRGSLSWRAFVPWLIAVNCMFLYLAAVKGLLYISLHHTNFRDLIWPLIGRTMICCISASIVSLVVYNQQSRFMRGTLGNG